MRNLRWILALVFVAAVWPMRSASARDLCFPPDQSPHCIASTFAVYWESNGRLPVFGYPIAVAANEVNQDTGKVHLSQWFERNRLERHPQNAGTPYEILLGLLGKDRLLQLGRNPAAEGRELGPKSGCLWFEQTGHNVCNQQDSLGFRSYWEQHGLDISGLDTFARSLQLFGLPLTEPKMETNASGNTVLTQWFERARFEWHPDNPDQFKILLGLVGSEILDVPAPQPQTWLEAVNYYRTAAGLAPVQEDSGLNDNCFQHARYMAENKHLTHNQDPARPWASAAGQICAGNGNAWIGGGASWQPMDAVHSWMESPGHRLWLLYPTTPTFGFGFYRAENGTSAAGLDVLSQAAMDNDMGYPGWPVRYPAESQRNIPARQYPITINWRYFGSSPTVASTSLQTSAGTALPHSISTDLPAGHKGIMLLPNSDLPANSSITVRLTGTYESTPFDISWSFTTGRAVR